MEHVLINIYHNDAILHFIATVPLPGPKRNINPSRLLYTLQGCLVKQRGEIFSASFATN